MKFTAAIVLASAVAGVSAFYQAPSNVTYTTEVVEVYTTYCPGPTEIVHGDVTYTVTEATTLTISDCPCTVSYPVIPTSVVECNTCGGVETPAPEAPVYPTEAAPVPEAPVTPAAPAGPEETTVGVNAAGQAAILSGAGIAGIVGLVALAL